MVRAWKRYGYAYLLTHSWVVASEVLEDEHLSVLFALACKESTQ